MTHLLPPPSSEFRTPSPQSIYSPNPNPNPPNPKMKERKIQQPNLHLHLLDTTSFCKSPPSMAAIISFLLFSLSFTAATALSGDSAKLLSFKSTLPNPRAVLPDWQPGKPPCLFTGVSCSSSGQIVSLDLTSLPLSTSFVSVSAHLFVLDDLTSLKLASTNLSGNLRPFSSCSPSLSHIDLSVNSLSGSHSDFSSFSNCRALSALNLSSNRIDSGGAFSSASRYSLAVQTLDVSANRLVGSEFVPWLLSSGCAHLSFLSLRTNKLEGSFSLDGCDKLQHLDVSSNNFSTLIPGLGGCARLSYLDLSSNKFSGLIGDGVAACEKLSYLNLSYNHFSGPIPALPTSSLEFLYLAGNHFEGGIHGGVIEACTSLVELDLSLNLLSGNLPTRIESCSSLELLAVSNNNLSGELPIDVLMKLSGLRKLDLSGNSFVGVLPDSLSLQNGLEALDLSSNNISGRIPSGFCEKKTSLKELYLQDNFLTGPIPPDLANCSQLVSLDLSFNYLTGEIPPTLGHLSKLKDLILLMNSLEGEIPEELMNIGPLENLILDYNKLTGNIPSGLRNCAHLHWISLSSNQLSGVIPSWIGELDKLAILKLSNNSFYGNIPPELGDCKSLLWLDLHTNLLNGTIPPSLPEQSGKLDNTFVVGKEFAYLKNNNSKECHGPGNLLFFAGIREGSLDRIPNWYVCNFTRVYKGITQPSFQHNGSMLFLGLSRNMLEGSIPKEIGSMLKLFILDLSHNGLSGPIPSELEGLESLNILDLSYNHLSGQIPQSLTKLTLLNELDLSNNDLTGLIPGSGQFETFPASRFFNNSGLCGYLFTKDCHNGSLALRSQHQRRQKQGTLIGSVAMGLLFSFFCIFGVVIVYVELKKRRKKLESTLGEYPDGNSNSGNHQHTGWKFTSTREALSINLATFEKPLWRLTFADLMEATNGFHNDAMIGSGGFGDVYKAKLKDGSIVAIKKLIHMSGQGDREFTAEMETIGKVKHKNLVPLLGYCKVGEERLLVYEYMKHGSLEDVLHHQKKAGIKLSWVVRRKIAVGAAKGLSFLHHNCTPHIIHRDMKSSNVLIDEHFEARVSDFGMARLMSTMDTHLSVSTLAGTPGYVPPEYYQSFRCSTKGDVYSYGVVLLELLTGRQPTDSADFGDNNLVGWVKQHANTRINDVFDPELMKEDPSLEIELQQHLKVAYACLDDRPWKRPTMIQVMAMFKEIQAASGLDNSASTIAPDDGSFIVARSFSKLDGVDMSMTEIPEAGKL